MNKKKIDNLPNTNKKIALFKNTKPSKHTHTFNNLKFTRIQIKFTFSPNSTNGTAKSQPTSRPRECRRFPPSSYRPNHTFINAQKSWHTCSWSFPSREAPRSAYLYKISIWMGGARMTCTSRFLSRTQQPRVKTLNKQLCPSKKISCSPPAYLSLPFSTEIAAGLLAWSNCVVDD